METLPLSAAQTAAVALVTPIWLGLRPPYWHPRSQTLCELPAVS